MSAAPLFKDSTRYTGMAGFAILLAIIFLAPIFFISPKIIQLAIISAEIQFYKHAAIRFLCALLFINTAAHLFGVSLHRLRGVLTGYILAAAVFAASVAAMLCANSISYSLREFSTQFMLWIALFIAPLYLTTPARLRAILIAATASAAISACIAFFSIIGVTLPYEFIYGADPVTIAREGLEEQMGKVEGGAARAAAMSTFGNPEFSGNFFAAGILLAGCWLLDGFGSRRLRSVYGWIIGLMFFIFLSVAFIQSQTRAAFVVILAGLIVRWLAGLAVRGWIISLWLLLTLASGFAFGIAGAAGAFLFGIAGFFAWQLATRRFLPQWRAVPIRSRVLLASVPIIITAILVSALFVKPVQLRLMPLRDRFLSAVSTEDRSVRERLIFYMMAGEMAKHHPFTGVGPGFFPAYYHETLAQLVASDPSGVMAYNQILLAEWVAYETHNDYFQMAAERGLPCLILFIGFMTWLLAGLVRAVREHDPELGPVAHALATVLCGYLTMMLFSFPLEEAGRLATFFLLASTAFALLAIRSARCSPATPS